jgi:hypothetical protein
MSAAPRDFGGPFGMAQCSRSASSQTYERYGPPIKAWRVKELDFPLEHLKWFRCRIMPEFMARQGKVPFVDQVPETEWRLQRFNWIMRCREWSEGDRRSGREPACWRIRNTARHQLPSRSFRTHLFKGSAARLVNLWPTFCSPLRVMGSPSSKSNELFNSLPRE